MQTLRIQDGANVVAMYLDRRSGEVSIARTVSPLLEPVWTGLVLSREEVRLLLVGLKHFARYGTLYAED
ncbi:MAG: hypothetical protein ACRDGM_18170 [bacterium]